MVKNSMRKWLAHVVHSSHTWLIFVVHNVRDLLTHVWPAYVHIFANRLRMLCTTPLISWVHGAQHPQAIYGRGAQYPQIDIIVFWFTHVEYSIFLVVCVGLCLFFLSFPRSSFFGIQIVLERRRENFRKNLGLNVINVFEPFYRRPTVNNISL